MSQGVLWQGKTTYGEYQVVDTLYDSRPARVLYSGDRQAAQSGVAKDRKPDLLFDYNQRMFELVSAVAAKRVLLIGGAVATLPMALLRALPDVQIDVVEPDDGLIGLAYAYFDLKVDPRLQFFATDGRSFLRESRQTYDVVLVDAFVQTTIPAELRTVEMFRLVRSHLRPDGYMAMNVISGYYGGAADVLRGIYASVAQVFSDVQVFLASRGYSLWLPQNFVLTAQQGDLPLEQYVRSERMEPPQVNASEALHDMDWC